MHWSRRSDGCRAWCAGLVGPALSALDAHVGYAMGTQTRAKDARRAAQHAAAAQEARSMLGEAGTSSSFDTRASLEVFPLVLQLILIAHGRDGSPVGGPCGINHIFK